MDYIKKDRVIEKYKPAMLARMYLQLWDEGWLRESAQTASRMMRHK